MDNMLKISGKRFDKFVATAAGLVLILTLALSVSRTAVAASDTDLSPSACQLVNAAAVAVNEATAIVVPPPLDLVPTIGAFAANLQLRLCKPKLIAPPDLTGLDGFSTVALIPAPGVKFNGDPYINDPACYASVSQDITQTQYDNIFGAELFEGNWGDLGTPGVFHANTSVDVRLFAGTPP